MIFVTVGTHEQQFDRLIEYIDNMKKNGYISEDIIMQIGFSSIEPQYCKWEKMFSFQDMQKLISEARIIVTHGGPATFIMPLKIGKIPIVFPRRKQFNEHINDHQITFCREVFKRYKNIIEVETMKQLKDAIMNYDVIVTNMEQYSCKNNNIFCRKFEKIVNEMLSK